MKDHLLSIGIMTGNSLDAADVVLTAFYEDGTIRDLSFHSSPYPAELTQSLRDLRAFINKNDGRMADVAKLYPGFNDVHDSYIRFVADAVRTLIKQSGRTDIDLIGFHGQTCAHLPPSVAKGKNTYTVQIGSGQMLSDLTGIPVVYDFRSDDILAGGEGAPLAPMHNKHIAQPLKKSGDFPITFINGGNTSNIAHITEDADGALKAAGWDAGPFNHFPDLLCRTERNVLCDIDGAIGRTGKINQKLLAALFDGAVKTQDGGNFLLKSPPKSGDPAWYVTIPELKDSAIPFADRLRTAEYFSAYALYHTLQYTPADVVMPVRFAVFGGGWKNPVIFDHFKGLLAGDFASNPVLPAHRDAFNAIHKRIAQSGKPTLKWSDDYGFDGRAMEARIFADMARCYVTNTPFSGPDMTGAKHPVVGGIIRYPGGSEDRATANLREWLAKYRPATPADPRWSRASA